MSNPEQDFLLAIAAAGLTPPNTITADGANHRFITNGKPWLCMACHAKGGDVLSYHMAELYMVFAFAAKALGAWHDDGCPANTADPILRNGSPHAPVSMARLHRGTP